MATNSPVSTVQAAAASAQKGKPKGSYRISSDILDDLASRFIINVPVEERENLIRICFQVELAHWFYLDFYCSENNQKCGIKQFAQQMFKHVPFLQPHWPDVDGVLENWKQYKVTVPTYGAILLSEDLKHVLLVQSFFARCSWGFPKGKINENEEPVNCAIREVYEETGYDIRKLIVPTEYIELVVNYQYVRLYLVPGVPLSTVFVPKTRNEIKDCGWFSVDMLPVNKHDNIVKDNHSLTGNSFFMILPFVKRLKKWVESYHKGKTGKGTGGKGSNNAQVSNSPVFGRESVGKHKIFFENNITGAGGSGSKNSANLQQQQQQQGSRQRQRHKSMGELDQPQQPAGGVRGKNNAATPNTGTQPSAAGSGQFYKNNANYSQQARDDPKRSQRAASVMNDSYQDVALGNPDGPSSAQKKSNKGKHEPPNGGLGLMGIAPVGHVERTGKSHTKRKLFDNLPPTEVPAAVSSSPVPTEKPSYEEFNEIQAWVGFRLDYSRFM